jgi:hypothetical protein
MDPGVSFRSATELFRIIKQAKRVSALALRARAHLRCVLARAHACFRCQERTDRKYSVTVTLFEIYNEARCAVLQRVAAARRVATCSYDVLYRATAAAQRTGRRVKEVPRCIALERSEAPG